MTKTRSRAKQKMQLILLKLFLLILIFTSVVYYYRPNQPAAAVFCSASFVDTLVASPAASSHQNNNKEQHHAAAQPASPSAAAELPAAAGADNNHNKLNDAVIPPHLNISAAAASEAGNHVEPPPVFTDTLDEVLESRSQHSPPSQNDLLYLSALLEVSPKEAQNILRANWTYLQHYLAPPENPAAADQQQNHHSSRNNHFAAPSARRTKKPASTTTTTTTTAAPPQTRFAATRVIHSTAATTAQTLAAATLSAQSSSSSVVGAQSAVLVAPASAAANVDGSAGGGGEPQHNTPFFYNDDDVLTNNLQSTFDNDHSNGDDSTDDNDGDGPVCRFSESTMLGLAAEYGNQTSRMLRFLCLNTPDHYLHLFSLEWEYVGFFLSLTAFVLALTLAKIIFHVTGLVNVMPDSCILILLGFVVGAMLKVFSLNHMFSRYVFFEGRAASVFFLILLPPIILESAYSLYDREFLNWFSTVMLFAVVGTLLNAFLIGPILYFLNLWGAMGSVTLDLTFLGCMTFASLISAVDPVAVLALFSELGVNPALYFLVFGESLFNDAITVVLFNTFHVLMFESDHITWYHILVALAKFFLITFGGTGIGFVLGVITTLLCKFTEHCRVVEPLLFFVLAYASYLLSELFHFSGIIGLIACGLTQWHYATRNVSTKSRTTVKYFSKMLASLAESAVFVGFGALLIEEFAWHTGFICWTLAVITVVRFGVTFGLSSLANRLWLWQRKITYGEQFIISYGGLRGAIAFALSVQLNPRIMGGYNYYHRYFGFDTNYQLMVTTTTVVILFTVFVQGITLKPIIGCLNVREEVSPVDDDDDGDQQNNNIEKKRNSESFNNSGSDNYSTTRVFNQLHHTMFNHMANGVQAVVAGDIVAAPSLQHSTSALPHLNIDEEEEIPNSKKNQLLSGAASKHSFLSRFQRLDKLYLKPFLLKSNHHKRKKIIDPPPDQQQRTGGPLLSNISEQAIDEIIAAANAYYAAQQQHTEALEEAQQQQQQRSTTKSNSRNNSIESSVVPAMLQSAASTASIEQVWQAAAQSKAELQRQRTLLQAFARSNSYACSNNPPNNNSENYGSAISAAIGRYQHQVSANPEYLELSRVKTLNCNPNDRQQELEQAANERVIKPSLDNIPSNNQVTPGKIDNRTPENYNDESTSSSSYHPYYNNLAFFSDSGKNTNETETDETRNDTTTPTTTISVAPSLPPRQQQPSQPRTQLLQQQQQQQRWNFSAALQQQQQKAAATSNSSSGMRRASENQKYGRSFTSNPASSGALTILNEAQLKSALSQSLEKVSASASTNYKTMRRFSVTRDAVDDDDDDDDDEEDTETDGNDKGSRESYLFSGNNACASSKFQSERVYSSRNNTIMLRRRRSSVVSNNSGGGHVSRQFAQKKPLTSTLAIHRTLTLPVDVTVWKSKLSGKGLIAHATSTENSATKQQNITRQHISTAKRATRTGSIELQQVIGVCHDIAEETLSSRGSSPSAVGASITMRATTTKKRSSLALPVHRCMSDSVTAAATRAAKKSNLAQ